MNLFRFRDFTVLLDYAHNPSGMQAIGKFLEKTEGFPKVGIISGTGDRRDEDLINLGIVGAEIFDEIVIRQDSELRGRTPQDMIDLLKQGIQKVDKKKPVSVVLNEQEAIISTIKNAKKGAFIVVIGDAITEAIKLIRELKEKEEKLTVLKEDIPNLN
jgi:cyanophycin synthetase